MKFFLKMLLSIICWGFGLYLLYKTITSFFGSDPWGLSFTFVILPTGIISALFLFEAVILTKEIVKIFKK